ncbi:hypothetical protein QE152_g31525 [Popillia japonica]|uniref:Uncharacterized protein n=1 Tax=Popillia japonica TaxID=7064 RepID=A0AAW1J0Z6_POPJA
MKINLRDNIKWIRANEFGYYYYKTSLSDYTPFLHVDLRKKGSKNVDRTRCKQIRLIEKTDGLTIEKLQNLKEQVKFVTEDYRWIYETVTEENMANPKKKRKTYRWIYETVTEENMANPKKKRKT